MFSLITQYCIVTSAESSCLVELYMVGGLKVGNDGGVEYILPTTLNPRYSPAGHPGQDDLNLKGESQESHISYIMSEDGFKVKS